MLTAEIVILFLRQRRQNPVSLAVKLGIPTRSLLSWLGGKAELPQEYVDLLYHWGYVEGQENTSATR